ncbi:MAG: radical SAM protein [Candidatus Pacebacteria bacterium]|nr:radical SAM protein [Candidatus Paceibacterota bacterium]
MKELMRFEPYYGSYIFSHNGKIYSCKEIPENPNCLIANRESKIVPYNGLSAPLKVQIQYTNRCNLNCPHCYVSSGIALPNEMTEEQIKKLLLDLREFGVLQIEWSGGEAFSRKNFLELVKYTQDLGFEQNVLTNGYVIGKTFPEPEFLWELFTGIQISIDGFYKNFNKWTGRESWVYVKSAVENLYKTKPETRKLSITTTLNPRNIEDLEEIALWVTEKNIVWRLAKEVKNGRSKMEDSEANKVLHESYDRIEIFRTKYDINVIHPFDKMEQKENMFPVEWHTEHGARWFMYIKSNGDVFPFPYWDGLPEFFSGNILTQSAEEIWYGKVFDVYRGASREKTACRNCNLVCQMWPRPFNYFREKDLLVKPEPHPNCPLT